MFTTLIVVIVGLFITCVVLGIVPVLLIGALVALVVTAIVGFCIPLNGFEENRKASIGPRFGAILFGAIGAIGDGVLYSSIMAGLIAGVAGAFGGFFLGQVGTAAGGALRDALRERRDRKRLKALCAGAARTPNGLYR